LWLYAADWFALGAKRALANEDAIMDFTESDFFASMKSLLDHIEQERQRREDRLVLELSDDERDAIEVLIHGGLTNFVSSMRAQIFLRPRTIDKCEVPHNDHAAYTDDLKKCTQGHKICDKHNLGKCPVCGSRF
jgi:hypothetical protein